MIFGCRAEAIEHTYNKEFHYFVDFAGEPIHGWACYTPEGDKIDKAEIENFEKHYDAWEELLNDEEWI